MSIATEIERIQNAKSSIKTAIENKGVTVGNGTIDTYASKIDEITTGSGENWYDTFWDAFQYSDGRLNYNYAFGGYGWTDVTFKPKYDMKPTTAQNMFSYSAITDLVKILENQKVILDTSNCTGFGYMFHLATKLTTVPHIDFSKAGGSLAYVFNDCTVLKTIEKLTFNKDLKYTNFFTNCNALENLVVEGEIGNTISLSNSSLLTNDSVNSVINALIELPADAPQTIRFHATVKNNLTQEQIASITSKNWTLA